MLKTRVITALLLLSGFLLVLFVLPNWAAGSVFALVTALAAWEWGGLLKARQRSRVVFGLLLLLSCLLLWRQPAVSFPLLWAIAALFWLLIAPFWLRRRPQPDYLLGCIVLLPTWAALTALHERSPLLLLLVMALVWVADIAAYFSGRAFGRHKLAVTISPGKTWEGVAGALCAVLVYGLLASKALPELAGVAIPQLLLVLLLLTALSILGDLFESLIKRQAGIKDSSQLLPGHGGILDRIDSQTSTLPLAALLLHWASL